MIPQRASYDLRSKWGRLQFWHGVKWLVWYSPPTLGKLRQWLGWDLRNTILDTLGGQ